MLELSQDAIRELRQSLPLLKRLQERFSDKSELTYSYLEYKQLQRAYNRVSELTSSAEVQTWVGPPFKLNKLKIDKEKDASLPQRELVRRWQIWKGLSDRLYLYVQGILESEKIEEMQNRLTQENTSLKEQLAELRRRESTYLETIKEAQTSATYSFRQESREILLDSLQRQHTILTKNLCRLQEAKAQHGLSTPLDILNAIDQTQQDLKQIEATIADLEAGKTDRNRKP